MPKFEIEGGHKLHGEIKVSGAKNSALKIFPAALLSKEDWVIKNVPEISDIDVEVEILKDLGASAEKIDSHTYKVNCKNVTKFEIDKDLAKKLRASVLFLGPLLSRFGEAILPHPGGDVIGRRPIDIHIEGFKALGAECDVSHDKYHLKCKEGRLEGGENISRRISHTGTENLILAAVLAKGKSVLKFSACEPEIPAMCDFLNKIGAKIKGAGTHTVEIQGVSELSGGTFEVIPDRIETGTFVIAAAITGGDVKITSCNPLHLEVELSELEKAGIKMEKGADFIHVKPSGNFKAIPELVTHEYPGFMTDLQPAFTVLMTQAKGLSLIHETVHDRRLLYTDMLNTMGAYIIMCDPHRVLVYGPSKLYPAKIESPDIRAGMALMIAAMAAEGKSTIDNIFHIERGYENIEKRLKELGAKIKKV